MGAPARLVGVRMSPQGPIKRTENPPPPSPPPLIPPPLPLGDVSVAISAYLVRIVQRSEALCRKIITRVLNPAVCLHQHCSSQMTGRTSISNSALVPTERRAQNLPNHHHKAPSPPPPTSYRQGRDSGPDSTNSSDRRLSSKRREYTHTSHPASFGPPWTAPANNAAGQQEAPADKISAED
jgi:hypothetical protein